MKLIEQDRTSNDGMVLRIFLRHEEIVPLFPLFYRRWIKRHFYDTRASNEPPFNLRDLQHVLLSYWYREFTVQIMISQCQSDPIYQEPSYFHIDNSWLLLSRSHPRS